MLVHGKNCSNWNIIDEQFQLVVLFIPPQGDQFNYFLFRPSPPSQEGCWGYFFQKRLYGFSKVNNKIEKGKPINLLGKVGKVRKGNS